MKIELTRFMNSMLIIHHRERKGTTERETSPAITVRSAGFLISFFFFFFEKMLFYYPFMLISIEMPSNKCILHFQIKTKQKIASIVESHACETIVSYTQLCMYTDVSDSPSLGRSIAIA